MNPLVTVITASYNSEETIGATIRSVNNQTYLNIEHILIDGCSADNTVEIFSNNSSHINLIISERDRGIYDAMNKGIDAANGEIIFILNSDDLFFDDYVVLNCVKDFVKNPDFL
jgi:glycosyltransferase involved in cell wall biosynthesis